MALLYALSPYALLPACFRRAAYCSRTSEVSCRTEASSTSGSSDSVSTVALGCEAFVSAALRSASLRFLLSFLLSFGDASDFYCERLESEYNTRSSRSFHLPLHAIRVVFPRPNSATTAAQLCDPYVVMPNRASHPQNNPSMLCRQWAKRTESEFR